MTQRLPLLLLLTLAACPAPSSPTPTPETSPADAAVDRRERAKAAAMSLGKTLKGELQQALGEGGPVAAIAVCNERAPAIAAQVSRTEGLTLGRTSHKLRNPNNVPPAWAEPWVAKRAAEPAFLDGPEGQLRALIPIKTEAACLLCHGPADGIAPDVKAALAERYPEDQATGFTVGDLRGWFWVEVP